MKIIRLSTKVQFVRHWGVWYRVQRGGAQWIPIGNLIKRPAGTKPESRGDYDEDPNDPINKMTPDEAAEELERRVRPGA